MQLQTTHIFPAFSVMSFPVLGSDPGHLVAFIHCLSSFSILQQILKYFLLFHNLGTFEEYLSGILYTVLRFDCLVFSHHSAGYRCGGTIPQRCSVLCMAPHQYDLLEVTVILITNWRRCLPGFSIAKLLFPYSSHGKGVTESGPHPGRGIKLHLLEEEPKRICQN